MGRLRNALFGLLLVHCFCGSASAALRASASTIEMTGERASSVLEVSNQGVLESSVQVRILRWRIVDGAEQLEPTRDLVASPPLARIKSGSSVSVRIVRVAGRPVDGEEAYRLLIVELPLGGAAAAGTGVSIVLQQSIPVFVNAKPGVPQVSLNARLLKDSSLEVAAFYMGSRRVKLTDVGVYNSSGSLIAEKPGLAGYVLSRSHSKWVFPVSSIRNGDKLKVTAQGDSGKLEFVVPVEASN